LTLKFLEFVERLKDMAGFKNVPKPILMRSEKNGPLYYLYFASQKDVANKIVNDILTNTDWNYKC
jgi:hypothetical protein